MRKYIQREDAVFAACKVLDKFGGCKMGPLCPDVGCSEVRDIIDEFQMIEIPEQHGRLGDLDRLVEKIDAIWDYNDMVFRTNDHCCNVPEDCKRCKWAETKNFIRRMVANAPTIIPAEPPKEEE